MVSRLLHMIHTLKSWQGALGFLLLGFALYANTLGHDFVWDDSIVIVQNPKVQEGISGIPALFEKENSLLVSDQYGYRPITLASFAVDYSIWGLDPMGGHLMNALYFGILCALIYLTLRSLFREESPGIAFFATLLFAVHPLHVEAVANIKSRDEIFALLFGIAALWTYLRFLQSKKLLWGLLMPLLFLLACLSKENAFTLAAVYPLVWLKEVGGEWKAKLPRLWPAFLCMALLGGVLLLSSGGESGPSSTDNMGIYQEEGFLGNALLGPHPESHRYSTGLLILGKYLKNFLTPYPLTYYAGYNVVPVTGWGSPWVWLSLLLHLLLLGGAVWKFRQWPVFAFGALFYLLTVSIYSQWLRPLSDAMADRFLFMPSLGLVLVLLAVLYRIPWKGEQGKSPWPLLALLPALIWAGLTLQRNTVWQDNLTLFESDLPQLDNCARCHYYYASALERNLGEKNADGSAYEPVIQHYRKSIEVSPRAYYSHIKLGNLYLRMQAFDKAEEVFRVAAQEFPQEHGPLMYRAIALMRLGKFAQAISLLEQAQKLAPRNPETYYHLGRTYSQVGQIEQALATLDQGKKVDSQFAFYYDVEGDIYWELGQYEPAFQAMKKALELEQGQAGLYNKIIGRSIQAGQPEQAERYKQMAREHGLGVR